MIRLVALHTEQANPDLVRSVCRILNFELSGHRAISEAYRKYAAKL